jgi:hypothetical protein
LRFCSKTGSLLLNFVEHVPWSADDGAPELFTGISDSVWTGVGAVGQLVALGLGDRGLIAIDRAKTKQKKHSGYTTNVPFVTVAETGNCLFASSGFSHQLVFALFESSEGVDFIIYKPNASTFTSIQKHRVNGNPTFVAFDNK